VGIPIGAHDLKPANNFALPSLDELADKLDDLPGSEIVPEAELEEEGGPAQQNVDGGVVEDSCESLKARKEFSKVQEYLQDSMFGPFSCRRVFWQAEEVPTVWVRGFSGSSRTDLAIHLSLFPEAVDSEFGDEKVYHSEPYLILKVADLSKSHADLGVPGKVVASAIGREMLLERFRTGHIPPSKEVLEEFASVYKPSAEVLASVPDDYNWEERYPTANANTIQDQGDCGSCYAFAGMKSYAQGLFQRSKGKYNVRLSEQSTVSCYRDLTGGVKVQGHDSLGNSKVAFPEQFGPLRDGCAGGNAVTVWALMNQMGGQPTRACDPYTGITHTGKTLTPTGHNYTKGDTCGSIKASCRAPGKSDLKYKDDTGSTVYLPRDNATMTIPETPVKAMIMEYGPVYMGTGIQEKLFQHKSGIYGLEDTGPAAGVHAMVIYGWGISSAGHKFWRISNSWGDQFGEKGYMKWAMQSRWAKIDAVYATAPQQPTQCAKAPSCHHGEYVKDCTCRCVTPWKGANCNQCGLDCKNGGTKNAGPCKCQCRPGYYGEDCSYYIFATRTARTQALLKWNIKAYHPSTSPKANFVFRNGTLNKIANIDSRSGSRTIELPAFTGELCLTASLFLGYNEFNQSKGHIKIPLPCLSSQSAPTATPPAPTPPSPSPPKKAKAHNHKKAKKRLHQKAKDKQKKPSYSHNMAGTSKHYIKHHNKHHKSRHNKRPEYKYEYKYEYGQAPGMKANAVQFRKKMMHFRNRM